MATTVGRVRIAWAEVVERAAEIAGSYSTRVTLRQLFYRLVAEHVLPNLLNAYKGLSSYTADLRRDGTFPALLDQGRTITQYATSDDPVEALTRLARTYRRDRTDGQDAQLWFLLEKKTLTEQVFGWVGDYGVPVVAIGGFGSVGIEEDVASAVRCDGRDAIAFYIGDLDPSGECIEETFLENVGCFDEVRRLAVTYDQIAEYGLVPAPGKPTDSRAGRFTAKYGELIQVEAEAIAPDVLEGLVLGALNDHLDFDEYGRVREVEARERAALEAAANQLRGLAT
jgi:hypothetical protein